MITYYVVITLLVVLLFIVLWMATLYKRQVVRAHQRIAYLEDNNNLSRTIRQDLLKQLQATQEEMFQVRKLFHGIRPNPTLDIWHDKE